MQDLNPLIRLAVVLDDLTRSASPECILPNPWIIPGSVYSISVQAYGTGPPPSTIIQDIQRDIRLGLLTRDEARHIALNLGSDNDCGNC